MHTQQIPLAAGLALCGLLASSAQAQIPISGTIFDGSGGPLFGGQVYHVTSTLTVPSGETLTISPSAILKFAPGTQLTVNGTLDAGGQQGVDVILTSFADDASGGDTVGDGQTVGDAGDWRGVVFGASSDASRMREVSVRFAGQANASAVVLNAANIELTDVEVVEALNDGVDLTSNSFPQMTRVDVRDCEGSSAAFARVPLMALANFSDNSASGNLGGNYLDVAPSAVSANLSLTTDALVNEVLVPGSSLVINAGATLSLDSGVVVKLDGAKQVTVNGTLDCSSGGVAFTSFADDSFAGDTNLDGFSQGTPGEWRGLVFGASSDASQLVGAQVHFAGASTSDAIELNAADITLTNCVVQNQANAALDLTSNSFPSVSGCAFNQSLGSNPVVHNVPIHALPGFSANTASSNSGGNYIDVAPTTVSSNLSLVPDQLLGGVLVPSASLVIQASATLSLGGGLVVKFPGQQQVTVNGTLDCTTGSVVFTSLNDDEHGGDTDGVQQTSGQAGEWRGLVFGAASDASVLDGALVRFAGGSTSDALELNAADVTLTNCIVEASGNGGIDLTSNSLPTITGCEFVDCEGSVAVMNNVPIEALPGLSGNQATGNQGGDYTRISPTSVSGELEFGPDNYLNGAAVLASTLTVSSGATLTLAQDSVLKFPGVQQVTVNGTLRAEGTSGHAVVFTSFEDDARGGDTNGDGFSEGTAGSWRGLVFGAASDDSLLRAAQVRFAGASTQDAIELNSADIEMAAVEVFESGNAALDLTANSFPIVDACRFQSNHGSTQVVHGVLPEALPGFRGNNASNNDGGDATRLASTTISSDLLIERTNVVGDSLVVPASIVVASGARLTLGQDLVLKFTGAQQVTVNGALTVAGTAHEPVVFTSVEDDAFGGDATGDGGATAPAKGDWRGIVFGAGAAPSSIEHALLRHVGAAGSEGLDTATPILALESVRVEHGLDGGFALTGALAAAQLVAFDCDGVGIELEEGAFDLVHATAVGCDVGIRRETNYSGTVYNSIAWQNASAQFEGFDLGQCESSNGNTALDGVAGNIDLDPLFVDASPAVGDLRLSAGSPCLNAAAFGLPQTAGLLQDASGHPRILDHDLTGAWLPDMGAHERSQWRLLASGEPELGEVMSFTVEGPTAFSLLQVGALEAQLPLTPYGVLLAGLGSLQTLTSGDLSTPYLLPVPTLASLVGKSVGFQAFSAFFPDFSVGTLSNLVQVQVRP